MDSNISFWFAFMVFITLFLVLKKIKQSRKQLPPGPPGWPVIGNILDLGSNPHQSFYKFKLKYGDLLWLRLGWTNTLVIQTAKAAEELFKNHDASFCDRMAPEAWKSHNFSNGSIYMGRYGSNWRFLRRLVTLGLMTSKQIHETTSTRQKCMDDMIHFIREDSEAAQHRGELEEVEFSRYVFIMTFNLMGNLVLSRDLVNSQSTEGNDFFHALEKVMVLGGKPNFADFFPILKMLDPQRIKKNMDKHLGRIVSIIEKFVIERIEDRKSKKQRDNKDFLDSILQYNESGDGGSERHELISTQNMIIIIVEMFFGGIETTTTTIEWVMTELFCNPKSMRRVKEELNRVVGLKSKVEESDIDHLPYLHAVIKESMRLHPVVPLLLPRNAVEDTNFMGYDIHKGTQIYVNVWAIGRDQEVWKDPFTFKPERFLGSDIKYRGQNFELLPFGSGRRVCVGYPLAHQILHITVASFVHCFDWEIDSKSVAEAMDISERWGVTVKKRIPLKAVPKKKIIA